MILTPAQRATLCRDYLDAATLSREIGRAFHEGALRGFTQSIGNAVRDERGVVLRGEPRYGAIVEVHRDTDLYRFEWRGGTLHARRNGRPFNVVDPTPNIKTS